MPKRTPISETDDLDILSAIWILSCNDDNPFMLYKSIIDRLELPNDFDAKTLIKRRPELFRAGILEWQLDEWKERMRHGRRKPRWLLKISDNKKREEAINRISEDDVFRNQFRVEKDAPKCSVEIIEWGLRHIERLRKDWSEEREGKIRRVAALWLPLGSLVLAGFSVGVTGIGQWRALESQVALKHYEVSFKPKQESYARFMDELVLAAIAANRRDEDLTRDHLNKMESAYYQFEPFLGRELSGDVFKRFDEFTAACLKMARKPARDQGDAGTAFVDQVGQLKTYFRTSLYESLFSAG